MRLILAAAFFAALAPKPFAQEPALDRWDARLASVSGEVVVHPAGGGDEAGGEADMPLDEGDRITTGAGATADVSLDGGSLIHLGENSDFTLEKTEKNESSFSLALGSLIAKIQKLGSQRLLVHTPTAVCAVRGTEFGVDASADAQTHVGVFDEGRVEVTNAAGAQTLEPNQETSVAKDRAPLKPFALKRFAARRAFMRGHRRRLAALQKRWKSLPPEQRRARRQQILQKMRRLRGEMREKREKRRQMIEQKRDARRKQRRQRNR